MYPFSFSNIYIDIWPLRIPWRLTLPLSFFSSNFMSVYTISDIQVHDWEKYQEYVRRTRSIAEKYGGRYHIRGGEITVVAGDWKPNHLIVIEFPSMEVLGQFRTSPEYQSVAEIRKSASTLISSIVVEGYDGESDNIGT